MQFEECKIAGAWEIRSTAHVDHRGSFLRAWCRQEFEAHQISFTPLQANIVNSTLKGTVRGLHVQLAPALEAKLVRCTRGAVFDVVVDLRPESPSYCAWYGTYLTTDNLSMLYIPERCAHGCQSMLDNSEIYYLTSAFYSPTNARGLRHDDPVFGIEWPLAVSAISEQDRTWPIFSGS
jgi:dTDP-4-dehydrorhamnose 3,5-epimerase